MKWGIFYLNCIFLYKYFRAINGCFSTLSMLLQKFYSYWKIRTKNVVHRISYD